MRRGEQRPARAHRRLNLSASSNCAIGLEGADSAFVVRNAEVQASRGWVLRRRRDPSPRPDADGARVRLGGAGRDVEFGGEHGDQGYAAQPRVCASVGAPSAHPAPVGSAAILATAAGSFVTLRQSEVVSQRVAVQLSGTSSSLDGLESRLDSSTAASFVGSGLAASKLVGGSIRGAIVPSLSGSHTITCAGVIEKRHEYVRDGLRLRVARRAPGSKFGPDRPRAGRGRS